MASKGPRFFWVCGNPIPMVFFANLRNQVLDPPIIRCCVVDSVVFDLRFCDWNLQSPPVAGEISAGCFSGQDNWKKTALWLKFVHF